MKTDKRIEKTCSCKQLPVECSYKKSNKFLRHSINAIKLVMPIIGYTLIPKCPVCLAGYLALGTGIGLSVTTATYLRFMLIIICILSTIYLVAKHVKRCIELSKTQNKKVISV